MQDKSKLVGARIRLIRKEKYIKQVELAEKIGVSQAHLSNIEAGRSNITVENLIKLHEVLQCPISRFFADIDKEQENVRYDISQTDLLMALEKFKKLS